MIFGGGPALPSFGPGLQYFEKAKITQYNIDYNILHFLLF